MKKAEREIYIILAGEIDWDLCGFCRYVRCEGSACYEGDVICEHPVENLVPDGEMPAPGEDCWGFKPAVNVRDCADIVGLVLANDWDWEKVSWRKEDNKILVAGRVRGKS